ncbi:MAG: hypothetical protein AMXMBFR58_37410 [Phycisphaerae bacterium]
MTRHRRTDPLCRRYRPLSTRTAFGRWRDRRSRGRSCPICCPHGDGVDRLDTLFLSAAPRPADIRFEWRSENPSPTEEKRAAILDTKPSCRKCGAMFHPRYRPPADLLCRECRRHPEVTVEPGGALF